MLRGNNISSLVGLDRFPHVTELNLSQNAISSMKNVLENISQLKHLRNFDLRHNPLNSDFDSSFYNKLCSIESLEK